jgi:hypothetical protein
LAGLVAAVAVSIHRAAVAAEVAPYQRVDQALSRIEGELREIRIRAATAELRAAAAEVAARGRR